MTVISNKTCRLAHGIANGYRSGLEEQNAAKIKARGLQPRYETIRLAYVKPAKRATYRPDFPLENGILIETKGRFLTEDRQKHKLIKEQHPELDVRFVFSNSRQRLTKTSKTTYAAWCEKYGFKYADKEVPDAWLKEPSNKRSLAALEKAKA